MVVMVNETGGRSHSRARHPDPVHKTRFFEIFPAFAGSNGRFDRGIRIPTVAVRRRLLDRRVTRKYCWQTSGEICRVLNSEADVRLSRNGIASFSQSEIGGGI